MKYSTFAEYDPRGLALAEPALLTVWSGIGSYHEELVLVGGLVPQYLCRHPVSDSALPRPGTLDVDLGIALGATAGQYGSLSADLKAQGFRPSEKFPTRFEKQIGIYPAARPLCQEIQPDPRRASAHIYFDVRRQIPVHRRSRDPGGQFGKQHPPARPRPEERRRGRAVLGHPATTRVM
jgi:hypothetical protein